MAQGMGHRAGSLAFALCLAAATGFVASPAEAAVTTNKLASNKLASNKLASNRLAQNKLASNKLASNKLASNKLASNKLASNKLASNGLPTIRLEADPAAAEFLATEDGREVFAYIVSCALPESMVIEATLPDAADTASPETLYTCEDGVCEFEGSIGLAPYWVDRQLDPKGQRWVSACLLARVNAHDTANTISLRGLAPQLAVSPEEAELYPVEEGAFFGNLFTEDEGPISWHACRGRGQAFSESGGLTLRDCAEPDPADPTLTLCGFNYTGDCASFTPEFESSSACRSFDEDEGTYGDCHAVEWDGRWPESRPYREIITTYVTE